MSTSPQADLADQIASMSRDLGAIRKSFERAIWERDQWRSKYLDLLERVHRLGEVQRGVEEVRHG
jgi:hypothetical protein